MAKKPSIANPPERQPQAQELPESRGPPQRSRRLQVPARAAVCPATPSEARSKWNLGPHVRRRAKRPEDWRPTTWRVRSSTSRGPASNAAKSSLRIVEMRWCSRSAAAGGGTVVERGVTACSRASYSPGIDYSASAAPNVFIEVNVYSGPLRIVPERRRPLEAGWARG
jgi:hypothetical protein